MSRSTTPRLALTATLLAVGLTACGGGGSTHTTTLPTGGAPTSIGTGASSSAGGVAPTAGSSGVPVSSLSCSMVTKADIQAAVSSLLPDYPVKDVTPREGGQTTLTCDIHFEMKSGVAPIITVGLSDTYDAAYGHDGSLDAFKTEQAKKQTRATPGPNYDEAYAEETGIGEAAYYVETTYHDASGQAAGGRRTDLYVHRRSGPYYLTVEAGRDRTDSSGDSFSKPDVGKGAALAVAKLYDAKIPH